MKSTTALPGVGEFIDPVAEFAACVFDRCCDTYGTRRTPLLIDGIHLDSGEPLKWEGAVMSNLACQQNFLRALDALGVLTGDDRYCDRADEWIGGGLELLPDPASDQLYWGGHSTYDLAADAPLVGNHELKCVYPYYDYLYKVDGDAMRRFADAFWHAHIWDWTTLLFNRHGEYVEWDRSLKWSHPYAGGPLPIVENQALSFINTGSDLICAGVQLHRHTGDREPLRWAGRLLSRYEEIRHPDTGLAGYQFNHREPCRVRQSFKEPLGDRADVNEVTVITNNTIKTRYGRAAVAFLNLAADLGAAAGLPFRDLVAADLHALAEHAYDEEDHSFSALLFDGKRLSSQDAMDGVGYCRPSKLEKVPADGLMFLAYARAHRLIGSERFRQMAFSLAAGMGWGDIDQPVDFGAASVVSPSSRHSWVSSGQNDACALFGLLELHSATGDEKFLASAASLGRRLLRGYRIDGLFVEKAEEAGYTSIDSALPLALLHLEAAGAGERDRLPAFYPNNTYFDPKVVVARRKNGG